MKKATITSGLLALSLIAIMAISTASALSPGIIVISGPGTVWQFSPIPENGEVISVEAYYYLTSDLSTKQDMPTPMKTIIGDNLVTLVFKTSEVKELTGLVNTTRLEVHATIEDYVITAGPGFAWGRIR